MKIISGSFAYQQANWNSNLANFLHQYDSRISLVDGKINFDGKFSMYIDNVSSPSLSLVCNDGTQQGLTGLGYWASSGTANIKFVTSDTMVHIFCARSGYEWSGTFSIGWVKTMSNLDFAGAYGGQSDSNNNFEAVSFYDVTNLSRGTFSIGFVANYTLGSPKIAYFDKVPLYHSSGDIELVNNAMSCSIVPKGATVTIDSKNYYAIGTRTLIVADSV